MIVTFLWRSIHQLETLPVSSGATCCPFKLALPKASAKLREALLDHPSRASDKRASLFAQLLYVIKRLQFAKGLAATSQLGTVEQVNTAPSRFGVQPSLLAITFSFDLYASGVIVAEPRAALGTRSPRGDIEASAGW
jgi:hypothetical protein